MASKVSCAPWQDLLLGSATTNSATYDECSPDTVVISTNAVTASGATSDNQEIVYQELCGNGQLTVKVSGLTGGYAGLFVRESSAAGARKGAIMTQLGASVQRQIRSITNSFQAAASITASGHQWLRITRTSTHVYGYWSTNGTSWNLAFFTPLAMTDCVVIGMAAYSTSSGTTINATFTNISVTQSDAIPATEVAFADSTLEAQGGDTVQICVNLQNPCYCSPVTVDVALVNDSLPHLIGFEPQTLTFEEGDTVQCFTVVLEESDSSGTYTFELTNLEGGNDSEIGVIGELVLEIEGNEPEIIYGHCGGMTRLTEPDGPPVCFDRFGNYYSQNEVALQTVTTSSSCNCSEFESEISNLEGSHFYLEFIDCVNDTGEGFDSDVVAPGNTLPEGYYFRRTACKVFADLSELILRADPPCSGENLPLVNVLFFSADDGDFALPSGTIAAATAIFHEYYSQHGGLIDGYPWMILNNGGLPDGEADDAHGFAIVDFDNFDFHAGQGNNMLDDLEHDLYTVLTHEALHILGFAALMNTTDGTPILGGNAGYGRFASFLELDTGTPVVDEDGGPYDWILNTTTGNLHHSCKDATADVTGPDILFAVSPSEKYQIFTGNSGDPSGFSHLEIKCDGIPTPSFLMDDITPSGVVRSITDGEKAILCKLGYQVAGESNCDCTVAGANDAGEGCEQAPLYRFEFCEGATLPINPADLTDNDAATGISHFEPLGAGHGSLVEDEMTGIWTFTPERLGVHILKYIPVSGSCEHAGNVTLVYISVQPCLAECEFTQTSDPVNGGYNNNDCNLVCNPEFYSNNLEIEEITSFYCETEADPGFELPGWLNGIHTPDYKNVSYGVYPNSGIVEMVVSYLNEPKTQESIYTGLTPSPGRYLFSAYSRSRYAGTGTAPAMNFHAALVSQGIADQLGDCEMDNNNTDIDFEGETILEIAEIAINTAGGELKRSLTCVDVEVSGLSGLWIYPDVPSYEEADPGNESINLEVDQIELVPDNFGAGSDATILCGQPVTLGGEEFCMVSDLLILYTWKDEANNTLLVYRVRKNIDGTTSIFASASGSITLEEVPELEEMPLQTTTYTLYREIIPLFNNPHTPVTSELCPASDAVTITVEPIDLEDPSFSFDFGDCGLEVDFTSVSTHGAHYWDFGGDGDGDNDVANPTFTFANPGVYTVRHVAGAGCVAAETEMEVEVHLTPDAGFTYDLTQCTGPFVVTVESAFTDGTHAWLFDGGSPQSTATATHPFYTPGEHKIKLTVTNACGQDAEEITIFIEDCTGTEACACNSGNTIGADGLTVKVSDAIENMLLLPMANYASAPSQQVCIAGTLEVDQLYGFFNSTLRMLRGSRIKINPGATLNIYNSFLHGCDKMWRGIEVEAGGSIKTVANTTIADAQYGVYFKSGGGGTIDENRFLRNFVGIYQAESPVAITTHCYDNLFLGGTLKDEFTGQTAAPENLPEIEMDKPLAGIWIDRSNGFSIHRCYFENSAIGVGARRANLLLRANRFSDIVNSGAYQSSGSWSQAFPNGMDGYGVLASGMANTVSIPGLGMAANSTLTFDNCSVGIDLTGYGGNISLNRMGNTPTGIIARMVNVGGLKVNQNRIENAALGISIRESEPLGLVEVKGNHTASLSGSQSYTGIEVFESSTVQQNLLIEDNTVILNGSGEGIRLLFTNRARAIDNIIKLNAAVPANGILIVGGIRNLLSENNIAGPGAGNGTVFHRAISVINSPGNVYCCNVTDDTREGFSFQGACSAMGNSSVDDFRGNKIDDHYVGLFLEAVPAPNDPTQIGTQYHTGNEWLGTYGSGSGAIYSGPSDEVENSLFIVNSSQNSAFLPINPIPSSGWFITTSGTAETCSTQSCDPELPLVEDDDTKRIAGKGYGNVVAWTLAGYVYKNLKDTTLQDSVLVAFVADNESSPLGKFEHLERELAGLYRDTALYTLSILLQTTAIALDSIGLLEEALESASGQDSLDILEHRTAILDSLAAFSTKSGSLDSLKRLNRILAADSLIDWNDSIEDTLLFISNEQVVHDVFLNSLLKGAQVLTSTQQADLEEIAEQCPFFGGNAVFRARALLALYIGPAYYPDDSLCTNIESFVSPPATTRKSFAELQGVTVYPNPADHSITLFAKEVFTEPGHITLYDLTGKLLKQVVLHPGQRQWNIDVADLYPGFYLYRINTGGQDYSTGKLSIIR